LRWGPHKPCLGWLQNTILLNSASWVARIRGVSHWCPARSSFKYGLLQGTLCDIPSPPLLVSFVALVPICICVFNCSFYVPPLKSHCLECKDFPWVSQTLYLMSDMNWLVNQ
jgi:hypothetical protein